MMGTDGGIDRGLTVTSVTTPARAFNVAFTPHPARPVLGIYSVRITCNAATATGAIGRIELRADPGAPATIRARMRNSFVPAAAALGDVISEETVMTFLFPPGWQGMLASVGETGAPGFAIQNQTEIVL